MGENNTLDRRSFLKTTGAAGAATALGGVASAGSGGDSELLVGLSATADVPAVQAELPANTEIIERNGALGYVRVRVDDGGSTYARINATSRINDISAVKYTENNEQHHALGTPDDDRFSDQYAPQQVNAPTAWDTTEGSSDVTIAVIDQGVKYDHPDLEAQFGTNKGKDFVDGDSDPYPDVLSDEYHGTHVAGIASATTNNDTGIAGMSDSTLLSGRALGENGSGSTSGIADAIQWAADQGADIVNMSLGGGGYTDTMKNAVSYAVNNGTLPICAAGNDGSSTVSYPAKYNECVAVSAVDDNEQLASFSNYGDIDVAAPGVDILSCWTTSSQEYNKISGTSMACPAAAGVAALGKAVNPGYSPSQLRELLKNSAVDIGLSDTKQGAGQVDAANIVGGDGGGGGNEAPTASFTTSPDSPSAGESVTFDGSGSSDSDGSIASYDWDFGDGTTATGETASHTYDSGGDYTATLTVTDDAGATDSTSQTVSVGSGGGGGSCGDASNTASTSGSLSSSNDEDTYSYPATLDDPCSATISLTGDSDLDCDLYVTLDGRTPTTSDFDRRSWNYGPDEEITLSDSEIDAGTELGILVDRYSGAGDYTLSIEELGTGSGDGGGNEAPTASFTASTTSPTTGETVSFDASGSSDSDGSIASYDWDFGDGTTGSGETVSHAYGSAGDFTVTLTVTDDAGATDSASQTISVEDTSTCGDVTENASVDGSLSSSYDDAAYSYPTQTSNPCQVTISLDGPYDADFDLYVTLDGRTPSTYDYDKRSVTYDSQEEIVVDSVDSSTELGILVDSWDGSGSFTLTAEEIGR